MVSVDPAAATILIVEDNPDNLYLTKFLLEADLGVKFCDGRPSGAQLFGMLAAQPRMRPDLILLDIQVPHEDGYTILKQIRERPLLRQTKVVALTANTTPLNVHQSRQAGFDGFIGKPIHTKSFPEQIRRILAGEAVWEP